MNWSSVISSSQLKKMGILGMNRRNIAYIGRYNPRHLFPLVDDKLRTKKLAEEHQIPTPKLLGEIRSQSEMKDWLELVEGHQGFVLKPAKGSGGKGILVISGRQGEDFVKSSGQVIQASHIERHQSNILAGLYSLGGAKDVIIAESLLCPNTIFEHYSYEGIPDIRVIVFRGYPVMAMIRLSTHSSDGKANLHQGAIGVGLDIATGRAVHAVQKDALVTAHPDTLAPLVDIQIPYWKDILTLAARCYDVSGLGYLGTDVVLDEHQGPVLLELNARPGLSIQIANHAGLLPRLQFIEKIKKPAHNPEDRVAFSQTNFQVSQSNIGGETPCVHQ
jgi:alpha-L-glutamate ligase-like protein